MIWRGLVSIASVYAAFIVLDMSFRAPFPMWFCAATSLLLVGGIVVANEAMWYRFWEKP
jgi:hypothetical protein